MQDIDPQQAALSIFGHIPNRSGYSVNVFSENNSHIIITQIRHHHMINTNPHYRPSMVSQATQTPETFPVPSSSTYCPEQPIPPPLIPQSPKEKSSPSVSPKRRQKKKSGSYYWSQCENRRYAEAVQRYSEILQMDAQEKRLRKVNVLLSRMVRTRSPLQCHTHHQKMLAKYGSLQNIVLEILSNGEKKEKVVLNEDIEVQEEKSPQSSQEDAIELLSQLDWDLTPIFRPAAAMHLAESSLDIFSLSDIDIDMLNYMKSMGERVQQASRRDEMINLDFQV